MSSASLHSVEPPPFERLAELAPELLELEARARDARDDGESYFCANQAWFPFQRRLRELVGVWRRPVAGETAADAELLGQGLAYESAFGRIYPLLPPCRGCGCMAFAEHMGAELDGPGNAGDAG